MTCQELKEVEFGVLSESDGSSRLYVSHSLVIVSVQGPAESRHQVESGNEALVSVSFCSREVKPASPTENVCVASIKQMLETVIAKSLFPRAIICISIHEGVVGGSFLSSVFNACFLALIDAGISMLESFVSLTIATPSNRLHIVNPQKEQELEADCVFVFVIGMPTKRELFCHAWGSFTPLDYLQSLEVARGEADKTLFLYREEYSKKLVNLKIT